MNKKWSFWAVPALLLVLLLMGCPTTDDDGKVESGDDGAVPKREYEVPFTETSALDFLHWKQVPAGNTYGVEVTAGDWDMTETVFNVYLRVMDWATTYADYVVLHWGTNGAGTIAASDATVGNRKPTSDYNSFKRELVAVNLREAIVFCNALSEAAGKTPVYLNKDGDILKDATKEVEKYVVMDKAATGYRLPTVDEFIYAGDHKIPGGQSPLPTYSTDGWASGSSVQTGDFGDAAVGPPNMLHTNAINRYGLAYIYGSCWEWCFNFDGTYGLMGGDIWTHGETPPQPPYDWTIKPGSNTAAGDPGSLIPTKGPSYSFRVRSNLATH